MRSLKKYGISKKLLEAFVEVVRNNPDPLCINDKIFVSGQPVSPALVRLVQHKDFARVFSNLGIYNLVLLPKQDDQYRFIAKLSDGNIHSVVVPRADANKNYINFTTAVAFALLNTIQNTRMVTRLAPDNDLKKELIYEDNTVNTTNPTPQFMTFGEMPPGLAEAIQAAGIKPITKEQWDSINVTNGSKVYETNPQMPVDVVTDVVDKLK